MGCQKYTCPDAHPGAREIDKNPARAICKFSRKCKRLDCFYFHPRGRDVDDDPQLSICPRKEQCRVTNCPLLHPEDLIASKRLRLETPVSTLTPKLVVEL